MAASKIVVKTGILDGILGASLAVQILLLIMLVLSAISWGIIIAKRRQLKMMMTSNEKFVDAFWRSSSLEDMQKRLPDFPHSNVSRVFYAAFQELQKIAEISLGTNSNSDVGQNAGTRLSGIDNLERAIRKSSDTELARAESYLSFLATVGSTSPFIGLLGTVVGIMTSFQQIASSGSASLAVVAPGISEALFSTAVGLFAALPAVAAYNYFVGQVKKIEISVSSFSSDFLNVSKRNFFKGN